MFNFAFGGGGGDPFGDAGFGGMPGKLTTTALTHFAAVVESIISHYHHTEKNSYRHVATT